MEEENWTFVEQKGEGTFAKVVKIWRKDLQCNRAVKKLKNRIDDENDKDYKRFLEECKKMQVLNHPNIVRYYETSLQDGTASVQMEYIEGDTLNKYLKNENYYIPYEDIVKLIKEIGSALAYCHVDIYKERMNPTEDKLPLDPNDGSKYVIDSTKEKELIKKYGILHNDLHSGNIIRKEGDNKYVLIDFGLSVNSSDPENSIVFGGAYGFIPPEKWIELDKPKEQRDANNITPAADIYSFGIIIFQMLTGKTPFGNSHSAYDGHRHNTPPSIEPLRRIAYENAKPGKTYIKDYPDWLEAMVMKCLEKDPKNRYANAKEFMKEYEANIKNDHEQSENERKRLVQLNENLKKELDKKDALNSILEDENQKLKTKNAKEEKVKEIDWPGIGDRLYKDATSKALKPFTSKVSEQSLIEEGEDKIWIKLAKQYVAETARLEKESPKKKQKEDNLDFYERTWRNANIQNARGGENHIVTNKRKNIDRPTLFGKRNLNKKHIIWSFIVIFVITIIILIEVYSGVYSLTIGRSLYERKNYAYAFYWLSKSADHGCPLSNYYIGTMYRDGLGIDKNTSKSVEYLQKATELGYNYSQLVLATEQDNLGRDYHNKNDYQEAIKWYKKSAELNCPSAQNHLGVMYQSGLGTKQNYTEAVKWYQKAAEQGYVWGQYNLACMFRDGKGVSRDRQKALEWFLKAAEQDHVESFLEIGKLYRIYNNGRNRNESIKWYLKAADKGNAEAMRRVADCYNNGDGVNKDYNTAIQWYTKAAELGDWNSEKAIGDAYYYGEDYFWRSLGLKKDWAQAAKWYSREGVEHKVKKIEEMQASDRYIYERLGDMYKKGGFNLTANIQKAKEWYQKAAESGLSDAKKKLEKLK